MTQPSTPLTDEDREAIKLLTESHFAEHATAWEVGFLESISEKDRLSAKERNIFEEICQRVLR